MTISRKTAALAALLIAASPTAVMAGAPDQDEDNSGQDPTRPVARVDARLQYSNLPGGYDQETFTLRMDKPFRLGGGWQLNTRFDLPVSLSNVPGPHVTPGDTDAGLDDALIQLLAVKPLSPLWAVAFGTQLILPIGTPEQFSAGKWQLVPTVAAVRQLPSISKGSFVGLLVRDTVSFAGPDRFGDTNVMSIEPLFNLQLPKRWFITFSPELKLDTLDNWKAALPFDMTVGKKLTDRLVMSLQTDVMLIDTYQTYDWKTELRIGLFF